MAKIGRPTKYTEKLADEICHAISTGSKGIPTLCKENPHWPSHSNIYEWFKRHKSFQDKYIIAKIKQSEIRIDEIDCLLRDSEHDFYFVDGKPAINTAYVARLKMLVDMRKWHVSKLAPKVYGDKLETKVTTELSKETIENLRDARREFKKEY